MIRTDEKPGKFKGSSHDMNQFFQQQRNKKLLINMYVLTKDCS